MTREFEPKSFEERKADHLALSKDPRFQTLGASGFDQIRLNHDALCELNFAEVSMTQRVFGSDSVTPFYVSAMTAGHGASVRVNEGLASACAERGWIFSVGSQRRQLLNPNESPAEFERVRKLAHEHGLKVVGNIGASQLGQISDSDLQRLVDSVAASALAVHLNPLQECMQPEGTPHFSGVLKQLERVKSKLRIPLVLKETGCGFSEQAARKAIAAGVDVIDVSGLGGTHWGRIEGARAHTAGREDLSEMAKTFQNWGIPTVQSLCEVAKAVSETQFSGQVWASGGVRSGLDAAKCIALGAHMVGYAQPALQAWEEGKLTEWMARMETELRIALFCTGSRNLQTLREKKWTRIESCSTES